MISATIVKIYAEHAYIQYPVFKCKVPDVVYSTISKEVCDKKIESFYQNHFVMETEHGDYIGITDGMLQIGSNNVVMKDSKEISCNFRLSIPTKLIKPL